MIWSIISENDILSGAFSENSCASRPARSSNPYDYIRCGYYLDKASMFGGKDVVSYNSDFSSHWSGPDLYFSRI
ncbi:MAG: hypothetical protein LUG21_02890 [Clostridiales bacterium]|nr:hypothetical protein [Clostridiales bacterium]